MVDDVRLTLTPISDNKKDKPAPFYFKYVEVPEHIGIGGQQRLAVHQLVGGGRVIDALGRDDADLHWTGQFLGEKAQERASYLDGLRVAGKKVNVKWHKYDYDCVIADFSYQFEKFFKLSYSITLKVIKDNVKPNKTAPKDGIDDTISSDTKSLSLMANSVNDNVLTGAVSTLSTAVKSVTTFVGAARSTINSVMQPLIAVQNQVNHLIGSNTNPLGAELNKITTYTLNAQNTALNKLPVLYSMLNTTNRMMQNLSLTDGATSVKTVTQTGGTLYDLAQQHYGDANQWTAIAYANGLTDPYLTGINTLKIPAKTTDTGGVYAK